MFIISLRLFILHLHVRIEGPPAFFLMIGFGTARAGAFFLMIGFGTAPVCGTTIAAQVHTTSRADAIAVHEHTISCYVATHHTLLHRSSTGFECPPGKATDRRVRKVPDLLRGRELDRRLRIGRHGGHQQPEIRRRPAIVFK